MLTRTLLRYVCATIVMASSATAHADNTLFTNTIPECRSPSAAAVPEKYLKLAKREKDFAWAARIRKADKDASGSGWELLEGSNMREWFSFYRADLNDDGYCDWYINAGSPQSSGGDRDSINTIYLGEPKGWLRIGAPVPNDKPDALGYGQADSHQARYLFGEDLALLYDSVGHVHYMISSFANRHAQHDYRPGYRIYVWDEKDKTLRALDKWEPGSKAAAAYGYFKAQGARIPMTKPAEQGDDILRFDPEVEAYEISQACDRHSTQWAYGEAGKSISKYLLAHCEP